MMIVGYIAALLAYMFAAFKIMNTALLLNMDGKFWIDVLCIIVMVPLWMLGLVVGTAAYF